MSSNGKSETRHGDKTEESFGGLETNHAPNDTESAYDVTKKYDVTAAVEDGLKEGTGSGSACCRPGKLPPMRGVITVVACFFVQLSLGFSYTFGNFMPYLTSYLRNRTDDTTLDYSTTLWVSNTDHLTYAAALLILGNLERCIPNRVFLFIGVFSYSAAFFGSYWAVQDSFGLVVFTYGFLYGLAQSVLYGGCVNLPLQWFPHRGGLVGGIVVAGYGGGAFVWNQIVTAWINPHNIQPDQQIGEDLYFTQKEVLDRVPTCFLVMGAILSGIQILCISSVCYPSSAREEGTTLGDITLSVSTVDEAGGSSESGFASSGSGSGDEQGKMEKDGEMRAASSQADEAGEEPKQYTVWMLMRTRTAWTIWWFYLAFELAFTFVVNFYKAYGQTFIHNDHLLSLVGSFASFFNAAGRPVWGFLADKFGYQPCLLASQAIMASAAATFLACEYVGEAMFFVWVCTIYLAIGGVYTTTPTVIFALFGSRNFLANLGFFITTGGVSALVTVFIASAAKEAYGWHGVFLIGAGCIFFALLLNVTLLLDCGHPIPEHMKRQLFKKRGKGK